MKKPLVLLVETDLMLREMYARQLAERFDVALAGRAQEAVDVLDSRPVDVVVTDLLIGRNDGIELIHELRSYDDWSEIPVVILSSVPERTLAGPVWQRYNVASFHYKAHTTPRQLMWAVAAAL